MVFIFLNLISGKIFSEKAKLPTQLAHALFGASFSQGSFWTNVISLFRSKFDRENTLFSLELMKFSKLLTEIF